MDTRNISRRGFFRLSGLGVCAAAAVVVPGCRDKSDGKPYVEAVESLEGLTPEEKKIVSSFKRELTQEEQARLEESERPIFGTLLDDDYTRGGITIDRDCGNRSYRDARYIIRLETDDKQVLALEIKSSGEFTKEGLRALLTKGDGVRFHRGNLYSSTDREVKDAENRRFYWNEPCLNEKDETSFAVGKDGRIDPQFGKKLAYRVWRVQPERK